MSGDIIFFFFEHRSCLGLQLSEFIYAFVLLWEHQQYLGVTL